MNTSSIFARLFFRPAILALTVGASFLVPSVQAQLNPPAAPPVTATDAKDFEAAMALYNQKNFDGALQALESFRNKYKTQSPRALEAKFVLGLVYMEKKMYDDAAREFRQLMVDPKTKEPAIFREEIQLRIAGAMTLKGVVLPSEGPVQKGAQNKAFEEAVAEYDKFLALYPRSRSVDNVQYNRATLLLSIGQYDEALGAFAKVVAFPQSPLRWSAQLNIGKARMAQAGALLLVKEGKEPKAEDVKQALNLMVNQAMPALRAAYGESRDVVIMNEAVFAMGQVYLAQQQNSSGEDAKKLEGYLSSAIDSFRTVRSREEVLEAQQAKIDAIKKAIGLLDPSKVEEYSSSKSYYEGLIDVEEGTKKRFTDEPDQFLGARLAIARIFLIQKRADECRVLIRYLQGQKELLEKEKTARPEIASLLGLTYIEQDNALKGIEAWGSFRKEFNSVAGKGNEAGDALPFGVAQVLIKLGGDANIAKASEVLEEARADYKPWRLESQSIQLMVSIWVEKKQFGEAAAAVKKSLESSPKPEVEADARMNLTAILRAEAGAENTSPDKKTAKLNEALVELELVRTKFPNSPRAEDAWYDKASILEMLQRYPQAQTELQQFIAKYKDGSGKSEQTSKNLPVAQYQLARIFLALKKPDDAIKAFRAVVDNYPKSEPASSCLFRIYDIEIERKNFSAAMKAMDEFIEKFPTHENVYFAFGYQANLLFDGVLKPSKPNQPPQPPTEADLEAGTKKLLDYVEYEAAKELKEKKGADTLIKISDRWHKNIPPGPYFTLNNEGKLRWQKSIDQMQSVNERVLKAFPDSKAVTLSLDRLGTMQKEMLKAKVTDAAKSEAYFRKLKDQYGSSNELKASILFQLATVLQETDPKKAAEIRGEAIRVAGLNQPIRQPGPDDPKEDPKRPIFPPEQWDSRLSDLNDQKAYDKMTPEIAFVRTAYPLPPEKDAAKLTERELRLIHDAQAIALFWEAQVLSAKGDTVGAGRKLEELAKLYPKSTKVMEADYGIILGKMDAKPPLVEENFIERLNLIIKKADTRGGKFVLPAKAIFLAGRIFEAQQRHEEALTSYKQLGALYKSVPAVASEAVWRAAEICRKQAIGELPVKTQAQLRDEAAKTKAKAKLKADAEKADADKAKEEAEKKAKASGKPGETKAADPAKPGETKAADPSKPEAKPTAKVDGTQK